MSANPTTTRSDMLTRLRARNESAYRELLEWVGPQVLRWCRRFGLTSSDAEEVFQESFLAVFRYLDSFERHREGGFRAWLWTIVCNKVADLHRRRPQIHLGSDAAVVQSLPPIEEPAERNDLLWTACRMVRTQFTETSWQCFWLTTVEGRSATDVAEELGMHPPSVRKAKSRVLATLRAELGALKGSDS